MDMEKEFGITGEVLYKSWERSYEQIAQDVRFGGANPEEAGLQLKIQINDEINKRFEKSDKWNKCGYVMVCVCVALALAIGLFKWHSGAGIFIAAIVATVCAFKMKGSNEKVIYAAAEFDKKYFGGEIFYRRKNG